VPFHRQAAALGRVFCLVTGLLEFAGAQFAVLYAALLRFWQLLAEIEVDVVSAEADDLVGVLILVAGPAMDCAILQAKSKREGTTVGDDPARSCQDDRRCVADPFVGDEYPFECPTSFLDVAGIENESIELVVENTGLKTGAGTTGGDLEDLGTKG